MAKGGGGTTSTTDIPPQFKPAFTQLFNSAFGAARVSAGQPGFGQPFPGQGASEVANSITGFGFDQSNPYGLPQGNSTFQNPYSSSFQSPFDSGQGPMNVPQGPGKGAPDQGAFGFGGQGGAFSPAPQQQQQLFGEGSRNRGGGEPPGTVNAAQTLPADFDPNSPEDQYNANNPPELPPIGSLETLVAGNPENFNQINENRNPNSPRNNYPINLEGGTTGLGSTKIPLAAGPPIVGQPFPEQFTAGTSPYEFEALQMREAIARQLQGVGNPLLNLGTQQARGDFLRAESNPYLVGQIGASLRPITEQFANQTTQDFNSQAINSGAFKGSSSRDLAYNQLAGNFGQQLLDTGTGIAFDNYQRERQLQQGSGQLIDQGALLNQLTPEMLAQVGLGQRELAQRPLDEALLQYQESINAPFRQLFPLASILQGTDIGSSFSTTVPQPSAISGGLIGALGGAGAGSQVGGQFDQSGLGAILGGLLGGTGGALG
jgi:hypothetical protein